MKQYMTMIIAAALALLLAGGITARIFMQNKKFDRTVTEALRTSEGYDQQLINKVNKLEDVLATRASFGYSGGKDPMTGKLRSVANRPTTSKPKKVQENPVIAEPRQPPEPEIDPVKLTAIIYDDDAQKYTAIVMLGERSFAVEVGDKVAERNIYRITSDRIYMETDSTLYFYDISGKTGMKGKFEK